MIITECFACGGATNRLVIRGIVVCFSCATEFAPKIKWDKELWGDKGISCDRAEMDNPFFAKSLERRQQNVCSQCLTFHHNP